MPSSFHRCSTAFWSEVHRVAPQRLSYTTVTAGQFKAVCKVLSAVLLQAADLPHFILESTKCLTQVGATMASFKVLAR